MRTAFAALWWPQSGCVDYGAPHWPSRSTLVLDWALFEETGA